MHITPSPSCPRPYPSPTPLCLPHRFCPDLFCWQIAALSLALTPPAPTHRLFHPPAEPVEIVEPTAIAALNMNWPGSKLTVHILDDGKRPEMARLVRRLVYQCKYMQVCGAQCWLVCIRTWRAPV